MAGLSESGGRGGHGPSPNFGIPINPTLRSQLSVMFSWAKKKIKNIVDVENIFGIE